jgi:chemotaxis protein methyltransferase CheR
VKKVSITMPKNISQLDYEHFKTFLEDACGIILGEGKQYLIVSRLTKLLRQENIANVTELLAILKRGHPRHIQSAVIDAMTTNETSWFRDRTPFDALTKSVFPELDKKSAGLLRIWSSACSSGQEPYTISMSISEYLKSASSSVVKNSQIVATDISASMLAEANLAEYDAAILGRGLSDERKRLFFQAKDDRWQVVSDVKRRVSFFEQNLLLDYGRLGKFDIIFCRNVLIYFSAELKSDILRRMAKSLNPKGYLFLGASETITGYSDAFEMVRGPNGVYYRLKS